MTVRVVTAPLPVVSWEQAKAHLRVDDDEKDYVEGLIAAAIAWIDGPAGWLGRALGPQLVEWSMSEWPWLNAEVPIGPLLEVESTVYIDPAGNPQNWEAPSPLFFADLPDIRRQHGDLIRLRYWAGYGKRDADDPTKWIAEVPAPIRQAILLLVGQWYDARESASTVQMHAAPFAVEALLSPYRVWR